QPPCALRRPHCFPTRRSSDLLPAPLEVEPPSVRLVVMLELERAVDVHVPHGYRRGPESVLRREQMLVQLIDVHLEHADLAVLRRDRKSTRLNSSHVKTSYAVF